MTESQEEFSVSGGDLLAKVKELIAAGNARRIIIKNEAGISVLEIPLSVGVAGAAAAAILAPALVAVGALAAILTKCTIVVVRTDTPPTPPTPPQPPAA
jgi:hypothetical protein